jgi:tetratricopeptide (TPR) repeat protein
MTRLTIAPLVFDAAELGGENPLTPLRGYETASAAQGATPPRTDYPDAGREGSILPYRLQDQYSRRRAPRTFKSIVVENDHLRATFLPKLGGRLWSLIHKPTSRELLFVNPVFQPANLAVRDAWFSGGVEWNVSIIGHSAFTCAPLFAARVKADDGSPALRLYEWDRIRRVVFQIDFWLPADKPFLMVRVQITNPNDHTIPMYWWSNIAVPEREDIRVLGPAEQAYRHDYDGSLVEHDVPIYQGVDVTYTTNRRGAADLYFRIPQGHRPWIAALDRSGGGLVHTSTDQLIGRKMFNWGMDAGGRRWQEFLAQPNEAYIEIQGGLAQTQGEYVAMPAGAKWTWLEAYGPIEADPAKVHGKDWTAAHEAVERALESRLSRQWLEKELALSGALAERVPAEILHDGSGWGALESIRREHSKQPPFATPATPFPTSTIGEEQLPWLTLLETGALPSRAVSAGPGSLMVQPEWRELLERAVQQHRGEHWLSWYHLGVMRYRAGDLAAAEEAWERSLRAEPSSYAQRDLAVLADEQGDGELAADLWLKASRMDPSLTPLALECVKGLLKANRYAAIAEFVNELPPAAASHGRIRLLRAMAALAQGKLDEVEKYFQGDLDIANIREKETSLSDLWFGWHEQRLARERKTQVDDELRQLVRREFPPPMRFDFRLRAD